MDKKEYVEDKRGNPEFQKFIENQKIKQQKRENNNKQDKEKSKVLLSQNRYTALNNMYD